MRITVIHPPTGQIGGTKTVSALIVESLSEMGHEIDYYIENSREELNSHIGLDIPEKVNFNRLKLPFYIRAMDKTGQGILLQKALLHRYLAKIGKQAAQDSDLVFYTKRLYETDLKLNRSALQYVHGPNAEIMENKERGFKPYESLISEISNFNLYPTEAAIFNSEFISDLWEFSQNKKVLHPVPADTDFPEVEWEEKQDQAVIVGRIFHKKRLEEAIKIVKQTGLELKILGLLEEPEYYEKLKPYEEEYDWLDILTDVPRDELKSIVAESKIGLNCRRNEPFGISVTEYLQTGTIPMVHNSGGPPEIVKYDEFIYSNKNEAVAKIQSNLRNSEYLLEKLETRRKKFTRESFEEALENIIDRD